MHSFSKDPKQVFLDATTKGYGRVRFQQGKPLLDRELNLLGDLAHPARIAEPYIGSGVPAGSDGFAINNLNVAGGDFTIGAGRCLVNGNEVVLGANTTYKTQPNKGKVTVFPATPFGVYLHIFPTEFTDVEDADLKNAGDVGFVTALREKTDWEVLTSVAVPSEANHYQLATIDPVAKTIADNRRKELTVASLRDEISAARGTAAKLSDRLDASLAPDGGIKANTITNAQLANDSITTNKLIDGSVIGQKVAVRGINEVNLANSGVSKRTIQDGAVSLVKLGLTLVANDVQLAVPAATANVPGEATVTLQTVDEHAFYLISVRQISPRPQSPNPLGLAVNWVHRILTVKGPGLGSPYSHQHQVVVQNPTGTPITVACKAFRIADT